MFIETPEGLKTVRRLTQNHALAQLWKPSRSPSVSDSGSGRRIASQLDDEQYEHSAAGAVQWALARRNCAGFPVFFLSRILADDCEKLMIVFHHILRKACSEKRSWLLHKLNRKAGAGED